MKYLNLNSYKERDIENFLDIKDSDSIFDSEAQDYSISSPFPQIIASEPLNNQGKIIDLEDLDIYSPANLQNK
jgi:hypothetical protein